MRCAKGAVEVGGEMFVISVTCGDVRVPMCLAGLGRVWSFLGAA